MSKSKLRLKLIFKAKHTIYPPFNPLKLTKTARPVKLRQWLNGSFLPIMLQKLSAFIMNQYKHDIAWRLSWAMKTSLNWAMLACCVLITTLIWSLILGSKSKNLSFPFLKNYMKDNANV